MSSHIEFNCGCKINATFVLAMCAHHVYELREKERESEEDYRRYERLVRSEGKGASQ